MLREDTIKQSRAGFTFAQLWVRFSNDNNNDKIVLVGIDRIVTNIHIAFIVSEGIVLRALCI